jgi:NADH-quinone oxidoreductase subunit J
MHVLVYTGAILVLFLFVIMLLNLRPEEYGREYPLPTRVFLALLCLGLFLFMVVPMVRDGGLNERIDGPAPAAYGSVRQVGEALFTTYALPFELVSALILVAIFGGVVLAKRKL